MTTTISSTTTSTSSSPISLSPRTSTRGNITNNNNNATRRVRLLCQVPGTRRALRHALLLADRRHALTIDGDGVVRLWDLTRARELGVISTQHSIEQV